MNEIVAVIESFGEYIFLGLLALAFLTYGGAFWDFGGLRAVLAKYNSPEPSAEEDSTTRAPGDNKPKPPSPALGEHHAVLSGLIIVVGLWGTGIVFNAISYGTLESFDYFHHRIIREAYTDSPADRTTGVDPAVRLPDPPRVPPALDYVKRTVRDEVVWRTERKDAANAMMNRSRLRVVRGALVAVPLFILTWFVGRIGWLFCRRARWASEKIAPLEADKDTRAQPKWFAARRRAIAEWIKEVAPKSETESRPRSAVPPRLFRLLCLALAIPLYFGYTTLESEYHLAARFGEAEVSPKANAEVAKLNAEARAAAEKTQPSGAAGGAPAAIPSSGATPHAGVTEANKPDPRANEANVGEEHH